VLRMYDQRKTQLFVIFVLLLVICSGEVYSGKIDFQEKVVAGSPDHFMEVRYVVLKGSNYTIGKNIAKIAQKHNIHKRPSSVPFRNKIQLAYMSKNYPILYERMRGVADAFGLNIEDSAYDFSGLSQYSIAGSGCSAVYYPNGFTESGSGILSRNYDFTTGTLQYRQPQEGEMRAMSRPYIFEIYPDQGYASLSICAFDLLGGVIDGINSEGLTVSILAEEESIRTFGLEQANGIGIHELLSMRYLLDNCKDVEEAKQALLYLKHYYGFIPCHYIIADRFGNSFIFEFSASRNKTFIIDGDGPQCITNHLVSKYKSIDELSDEDSHVRFKTLHSAVSKKRKFSIDEIKSINSMVAVPPKAFNHPEHAPVRTLWHALYDTEKRSLSVKFYLGEKPDPTDKEKVIFTYSDYIEFQLKPDIK